MYFIMQNSHSLKEAFDLVCQFQHLFDPEFYFTWQKKTTRNYQCTRLPYVVKVALEKLPFFAEFEVMAYA